MSRSRTIALAAVTAALFAPGASADGGPSPGVSLDGTRVRDAVRGFAYAVAPAGNLSVLIVRDPSGGVVRTKAFEGTFGLPRLTFGGPIGGLSPDGKTLVLARASQNATGRLAAASAFLVLDAPSLKTRRRIVLRGDLSFDALSPDGRTLFLIEHTSARDLERYRVRAYDLRRGLLRRRAIVDRTEPNMAGYPVLRTASPGGEWVYTLYVHYAGGPFVHALDTVHARARCLDLEWDGAQDPLWTARLALRHNGQQLAVLKDGSVLGTLKLPPREKGMTMGWRAAGGAGAAALAVAATGLILWLRRRPT